MFIFNVFGEYLKKYNKESATADGLIMRSSRKPISVVS